MLQLVRRAQLARSSVADRSIRQLSMAVPELTLSLTHRAETAARAVFSITSGSPFVTIWFSASLCMSGDQSFWPLRNRSCRDHGMFGAFCGVVTPITRNPWTRGAYVKVTPIGVRTTGGIPNNYAAFHSTRAAALPSGPLA